MAVVGADERTRAVRYGAWPIVALGATVALATGELQSLSQAVDGIQREFHVSDRVVGFLPFAAAIVGVLGAPIFGALADRVRRTGLLALAALGWVLCIGLNGLAPTFLLLFVSRAGIGGIEANGSASLSLLSDYYPVRERAKRFSLYNSGALVGAMVGLVGGGVAVSVGGWRWAFLMWVPIGLVVAFFVARLPEPSRGDQDSDFEADMTAAETQAAEEAALAAAEGGMNAEKAADIAAKAGLLPAPRRTGTMVYAGASWRDVLAELWRIPSLWFGVMAITISSTLLNALQFWGVPYFKRVHHLGPAAAGGVTALFGLGAAVGIVGGGFLSDRYLKRGVLNARVYVVAMGGFVATVLLVPAFASTDLLITSPLLLLGGVFLTLPVAPADAIVADVVVPALRGRAYAVRGVVRALSSFGPVIIGLVSSALISAGASNADGLRLALVGLTPVYAIGGVLMLLCARTYPSDVAFVVAESRRVRTDLEALAASRVHTAEPAS